MQQENHLKTLKPRGEVLRDLLKISEYHNITTDEFLIELKICINLIEKSKIDGISNNMKEISSLCINAIENLIK